MYEFRSTQLHVDVDSDFTDEKFMQLVKILNISCRIECSRRVKTIDNVK